MPVWTVEVAGGGSETVEAGLVGTEFGALVALSDDGLVLCAWAPGQWKAVRLLEDAAPRPTIPRPAGNADTVLVGLPRS
jgi:hypothetical protein